MPTVLIIQLRTHSLSVINDVHMQPTVNLLQMLSATHSH